MEESNPANTDEQSSDDSCWCHRNPTRPAGIGSAEPGTTEEVGLEEFCCNNSQNHEEKESFVSEGVKAIVYPVKDVAQAKKLYSTLWGVDPLYDEPYYVGFSIGGLDTGLDPHGHS